MLTQTMPALTRALNSTLPPAAIKQLAQTLGNCNQPLTHRGDVNVQPSFLEGENGLARGGGWNPNDPQFAGLIPAAGTGGFYDIPGYSGGGWNTANYYGDQFFFQTSQEFTSNNYFGGPNNYFGGDTYFDQSTHNTIYAYNVNTTLINGQPIPGTPGPAGPPGQPGPQGEPGQDREGDGGGGDGIVPRQFTIGPFLRGSNPRVRVTGYQTFSLVTGVTFDPDTCQIQQATATVRVPNGFVIDGFVQSPTYRVYGP
jgi:hypothetical protein